MLLPAFFTSWIVVFTSSSSTSAMQVPLYWYPPLRKKCIPPITFFRSSGKSHRGGIAVVACAHNLNKATFARFFLWTMAFTKWVVPMLTLAIYFEGFFWSALGSCFVAELIALTIPDVTSQVVKTFVEHRISLFSKITASVFVSPTSTPTHNLLFKRVETMHWNRQTG